MTNRTKRDLICVTGEGGPCITYKQKFSGSGRGVRIMKWAAHCKTCKGDIFVDGDVINDGNDYCLQCGNKLGRGFEYI